ncbi:MAG: hypothetical protein OEM77_08810 [Nitrosopumilus sp.]|nr:hypothetical protein [Nitrosopumilus sp.]
MKITEIEIDDSQTGYYWIQIYASNKKQAISLKHQILDDQAIRERLENEIKHSQNIITHSSSKMEMAVQNLLIDKLLLILEGEEESL